MTISTATAVKLAELTEDPENVRDLDTKTEKTAIESLAASITGVGLLQPLLITQDKRIIDGHRRYRALKLLENQGKWNGQGVPVQVMTGDATAIKIAQLVANLQREELDPIQEATMLFTIVNLGETQKALAERIGLSQATISKRLSLLSLPPKAQSMVLKGTLTIEDAAKLAKVADHPKEINELIERGQLWPGTIDRFVANILAVEAVKVLTELLTMRGWMIVSAPGENHRHVRDLTAKAAKELLTLKDGQVAQISTYGGEIRVAIFRTVEADKAQVTVDKRQEAHDVAEKTRRKEERETRRQDQIILKAEVISATTATVTQLLVDQFIHQAGFDAIRRAAQLLEIEPVEKPSQWNKGKMEKNYQGPLFAYAEESLAKTRQVVLALMVVDEMHAHGPAWEWRKKVLKEADRSEL